MKRNSSNRDWTALFRSRLNFLSFFSFSTVLFRSQLVEEETVSLLSFSFSPNNTWYSGYGLANGAGEWNGFLCFFISACALERSSSWCENRLICWINYRRLKTFLMNFEVLIRTWTIIYDLEFWFVIFYSVSLFLFLIVRT